MRRLFALVLMACAALPAQAQHGGDELRRVDSYRHLLEYLGTDPARVHAVVVFATWCDPCRTQVADLIAYAREGGAGLDVRFLSVDELSESDEVTSFFREHGYDDVRYIVEGPGVIDELAQEAEWTWDGSVPLSFVISGGEVLDSWIGALAADRFAERVGRASRDAASD